MCIRDSYNAMLRVFFTDATSRMLKNGQDALVSFAEGDLLRIMLMGMKRFTSYTPTNVKKDRQLVAETVSKAGKYCF